MSSRINSKEELLNLFSWADYAVFVLMLALSTGIGIFYGCFGSKMKDKKEFLMAGKSMSSLPVSMSLLASFMSAITLLGSAWEIYNYDYVYWLVSFSFLMVMPATAYLYIPVFWNLQLTSVYEYLEFRFNKSVRLLASSIFIIQTMFYMAIVIYAPSLALAQVTGINVYVSVCVITTVCVFYTALGGIKAVIWTDVVQVTIMFGSMLFVVIQGTINQGGFQNVWEIGSQGNRTKLVDWSFDPRTRHTFWSLIVGGYFYWIYFYAVHQSQVQRYLCLKDRFMVNRVLFMTCIGLIFLINTCIFAGLLVYAKYRDCDPIKAKIIDKGDQILPLFVMELFGHLKGLPGLYIAGVFSGSLSTVSTGINSLAAIVLEDFIKGSFFPNLNPKYDVILSKGISFILGTLALLLVFVVERQEGVLNAAHTILGVIGGPLHGLFILGLFLPWANSVGAFVGTLLGFAIVGWIGAGKFLAVSSGEIVPSPSPVSTEGCLNFTSNEFTNNATMVAPIGEVDSDLMELYKLSYMYYSMIGTIVVVATGLAISFFTGGIREAKRINPKLISPIVFKFCKSIVPGYYIVLHKHKEDDVQDIMELQ